MPSSTPISDRVWNVPNVLSMIRLGMALAVVGLVPFGMLRLAFVLFVIAAATDWLDGWWARRFQQVTQLGRILDPFCDKMIICGTYISLAVEMRDFPWYAAITGWMAVIVMGREMLVTALRSFIEQAGGDFSAKFAGKLKMLLQCIAVGAAFVALIYWRDAVAASGNEGSVVASAESPLNASPRWVILTLILSAWSALLVTLYSGAEYVVAAARFLRRAQEAAKAASPTSPTGRVS